MTPKTPAERNAALRKRDRKAGLVRVEVKVPKEAVDHMKREAEAARDEHEKRKDRK